MRLKDVTVTPNYLNMLRQEKICKKGIKAKRFKAALASDHAEKVQSTIF